MLYVVRIDVVYVECVLWNLCCVEFVLCEVCVVWSVCNVECVTCVYSVSVWCV